jgi:DNA-binding HxlR family transcriptional regulator
MGQRQYRQHCAIAKSLDLLGDRWTLLVVRDLLDGPKRYVDLLDGLVSIPTDTLAARLKELERHDLVERFRLDPPAAQVVYRLTERGREIEPIVDAYARWGRPLIEARDPDDAVRPEWLARALRALVRPDRNGVDLVVAMRTPDGDCTVRITDDRVERVASDTAAHVTLTGAVDALASALDPTQVTGLLADGRLAIEGARSRVRQLARVLDEP